MVTFFKSLDELLNNCTVTINIAKKDGKQIVSVLPKPLSENKIDLIPLVLNGTAEELDEKFFETISMPIRAAASKFSNEEEFSNQLKDKTDKVATKSATTKSKTKTKTIVAPTLDLEEKDDTNGNNTELEATDESNTPAVVEVLNETKATEAIPETPSQPIEVYS